MHVQRFHVGVRPGVVLICQALVAGVIEMYIRVLLLVDKDLHQKTSRVGAEEKSVNSPEGRWNVIFLDDSIIVTRRVVVLCLWILSRPRDGRRKV